MERTAWILLILGLLFLLVAVIPWALQELSLHPGTVPPGWEVVEQKTLFFPTRDQSERIYDASGFPTADYGFPVDRTVFPFTVYFENYILTVTDTWQDSEGCAIQFSYLDRTHTIYVYRPSGRTYPAEIAPGVRVYIIDCSLPERSGDWRTAGGEYFYGFRSVTLAIAVKV